MSQQAANITELFQRTCGYGRRLAFAGHTPVLITEGDDPDQGELIYWPDDWRHGVGASAVVDGPYAALLDGFGKPYTWTKLKLPRCMSDAKRLVRLWNRAVNSHWW
jgi:hypothetical protein